MPKKNPNVGKYSVVSDYVKFRYSTKTTKIDEIFHLI